MRLEDFIGPTAGELTGTNSANYGQCVGLVQDWFQVENEPFFYGDAKDLYANAPSGSYTKGTSWPAPAGSAGVMDASWGGGAGHTWISLGDGRVFEQNNPIGHAPVVSNYGSIAPKGYIGWILPNNYKGDQEVANPTSQEILTQFRTFQGSDPTADQMGYYMAHDWGTLNGDLLQEVFNELKTLKEEDSKTPSPTAPVSVPVTPVGPTTTAIGVTTPDGVTVSKDSLWASFKKFLGL